MENEKQPPVDNNLVVGQKVSTIKRGSKELIEGVIKRISYEKRFNKWFCLIETEDKKLIWKRANKVTVIN